jgi:hypothetical protein
MNAVLYLAIFSVITIFCLIFFLLYVEVKKGCEDKHYAWLKNLRKGMLTLLADYVIFGQGVGASVSGFTIVELLKDKTSLSSTELTLVFIAGSLIFELSRRLQNRLKNN